MDPSTESAVTTLLMSVGENPQREGLRETPKRVARMYGELTAGYSQSPHDHATLFEAESTKDLVTIANIPFYSLCEHHLVPFFGQVHIGYLPKDHILGLSKFARIVDVYAKRLQVQERLTHQIADAIEDILKPQGVAVSVSAEHLCMSMRGVNKPGSQTYTETLRGLFVNNNQLLERFYHACR